MKTARPSENLAKICPSVFAGTSTSAFAWTFLFHGEFIDEDSGLYNYGFRFYNPSLGRWLSRDPKGEEGGLNFYAMVKNNSINIVDFLGLELRNCIKFSRKIDIPLKSLVDPFLSVLKSIPKVGIFGSAEVEGNIESSIEECEECCGNNVWKKRTETKTSGAVVIKGSLGIGTQVDTPIVSGWAGGKGELSGGGSLSDSVIEGGCLGESGGSKRICIDISGGFTGSAGGEVKVMMGSVTFGRLTADFSVSFTGVKACFNCGPSGCSYAGTEGSLQSQGSTSVTGCIASQCITRTWNLW